MISIHISRHKRFVQGYLNYGYCTVAHKCSRRELLHTLTFSSEGKPDVQQLGDKDRAEKISLHLTSLPLTLLPPQALFSHAASVFSNILLSESPSSTSFFCFSFPFGQLLLGRCKFQSVRSCCFQLCGHGNQARFNDKLCQFAYLPGQMRFSAGDGGWVRLCLSWQRASAAASQTSFARSSNLNEANITTFRFTV